MQIAQLIKDNYGIDGEVSQLPGERDLNYKITTSQNSYIFKIHNAAEREFIALQQKILSLVSNVSELAQPTPLPALSGNSIIDLPDGKIGRLLTWAQGNLFSQSEKSEQLKQSLGSAVALVDKKLVEFDVSPYLETLTRPFGWNALHRFNF
jgi:Ser/Thr protein kinase RdoA (MazF antagonist)